MRLNSKSHIIAASTVGLYKNLLVLPFNHGFLFDILSNYCIKQTVAETASIFYSWVVTDTRMMERLLYILWSSCLEWTYH